MSVSHYLISNNKLTWEIPPWICSLKSLYASYNNLSGELPRCLGNFSYELSILKLQSNKFHGSIPSTFMHGTNLRMIDLSYNLLRDKIPRSLADCTMLEFLDLGNNQIRDTFPSWLGNLLELKVLILQSNKFHGVIRKPETGCKFSQLRIIDLSRNRFADKLPSKYFQCWNAMKVVNASELIYIKDTISFILPFAFSYNGIYDYSLTMSNKGMEMEYQKISNLLIGIILSSNRFMGEIPASIANLKGLHVLDLSNNSLGGHIPSSLGDFKELESLDVFENRLFGKIPQQLVELTFLGFINVSNNRLTGLIPQGTQFDTFNSSSFGGNLGLCGRPLSEKCEDDEALKKKIQDRGTKSSLAFDWRVVALMGYGSGLIIGVALRITFVDSKWFALIFRRQLQRLKRKSG